jgi:polyhydroxybutyrate depolymerase
MRTASRVVVALALGAACRTAEPPPPPPADPSPADEARALVEQARRDVDSEIGNAPTLETEPGARVRLPATDRGALPLLVFLHGLGGSGSELVDGLHLADMAEAFGFAFIAPDGTLDGSGRRFWNASDSCCNFDGLAIDHVAALRRWIVAAVANPRVDARRVYLVGFSNGGFLAYRAACEMGSLLAGIISIAGAGPGDTAACHPEKALSVVQIHGDRDPIVKFDGGHLFADSRRPRYPGAEKSLAYWAKFDRCTGQADRARELDLDPRVPGAETVVSSYAGCPDRRVELWKIAGGDHTAGLSRFSLKAILDFIASDRPGDDPALP